MSFIIQVQNKFHKRPWYYVQGPSGIGMVQSKAKSIKFQSREAAQSFLSICSLGDDIATIVEI